MLELLIGNKNIIQKVFIIAELSANHGNDITVAKKILLRLLKKREQMLLNCKHIQQILLLLIVIMNISKLTLVPFGMDVHYTIFTRKHIHLGNGMKN